MHATTTHRTTAGRAIGAALLAACSVSLPAATVDAAAAPGTLTTFAGGVGAGPALNLGQAPLDVAVSGNRVYEVDGMSPATGVPPIDVPFPSVVRAIDLQTGDEEPVAGNMQSTVSPDGVVALRGSFGGAFHVAVDGSGKVYMDSAARIREVDGSGILRTVAGTGTRGFSGDGGPATAATIERVGALAIGPDGSLYFSDPVNLRVRRVGTDGTITTVAGNGTAGTRGDGGLATAAQLNEPGGLGFDGAGNLYIQDANADDTSEIRVVDRLGIIRTRASSVQLGHDIAVDPGGSIFAPWGNTIRRLDRSGTMTTVAGQEGTSGFAGDGGPATRALLDGPGGLALDGAGNLYFADSANLRVRSIRTDGVINTVAGNGLWRAGGDGGPAAKAQLPRTHLVRVGPDGTYIYAAADETVRMVDTAGIIRPIYRAQQLSGMAVDQAGNLYLSEPARIVKRDRNGVLTVVAGTGSAGQSGDGGPATQAQLVPGPLALDGRGNLFVVDYGLGPPREYNALRMIDPAGIITTVMGESGDVTGDVGLAVERPLGAVNGDMVIDAEGAIFFTDEAGYVVRVRCGIASYTPIPNFDGRGTGLALDRAGDVFTSGRDGVYERDAAGHVTRVAGGGTQENQEHILATDAFFSQAPESLALDASGNLLVTNADRVVEVAGVTARAATPGTYCRDPFDRPVWGWGWNGLGQLGDGSFPGRSAPDVDHPPLTGAVSIAAGAYHSLALEADGTVWAWGWNGYGQIGDGTQVSRSRPVRVPGLVGVKAIAAGLFHSVAVKNDGSVWAWGWNGVGQLGVGTTTDSLVPERVGVVTNAVKVAAGTYDTFAVTGDGAAWGWGWNGFGAVGDGTTTSRSIPVRVAGLSNVTSIAAGIFHSLATTADGSVWGWGWNGYGQLGDGTTGERHLPTRALIGGATAVAAGGYHSLALKGDGTVAAWGWNALGQLGTSSRQDSPVPTLLSGLRPFTQISAGLYNSFALGLDQRVWGWGWNALGQVGGGPARDVAIWPTLADSIDHATAVASGGLHTLALFDLRPH
jgi:alpha-tubulin suppressor-like RCC1 family protein